MQQLCTHCSWCISCVTGRSAIWSPPSLCRPSGVLRGATHGGGFICGGAGSDSHFHGPFWRWHCLLVGHSRLSRVGLSDRLCCLGHAQHCRGWRWHSLDQSTWAGHPCNPLGCAPQPSAPPDPREGQWDCGSSSCQGLRRWQPPFGVVYGRESWWEWWVPGRLRCRRTKSGHAS